MFANKITIPHWKSYIFDKATPAQHQDSKMKIVIILITNQMFLSAHFLLENIFNQPICRNTTN